ncbi:hypothetical protein ES708_10374 [subsurface metagenome]
MVGITRFNITDEIKGTGKWRFEEAKKRWPAANALYREIFAALRMPLLPGDEEVNCTLEEFEAGYDYQLGIDVILRPVAGGEGTLQEKFLFTDFDTVTIEHCQDWLTLEKGDFFKLKANYYFVGYDPTGCLQFGPWVLLDWPRLQRATAQGRIKWRLRGNLKDKARASFMYVKMDELPADVRVASSNLAYSLPSQPQLTATPPLEAGSELERLRMNWRQVIEQATEDTKRTPVIAILRSAGIVPVAVEGDTVVLAFRYPLHKVLMEKMENQRVAERIIGNFLGHSCHVRCQTNKEEE